MKIKKRTTVQRPAASAAPSAAQGDANPRQFKSVEAVVRPDMIAFHYWREWFRAKERNDWDFMYSMALEGSPLQAQLGDAEGFAERCRRRDRAVPGLRDGQLRKIRLDGPDVASMYYVVGVDDRTQRELVIERYLMLRGPRGWNMVSVDEAKHPRADVMASIDAAWFPAIVLPEDFVGRSTIEAASAAMEDVTATHRELV